MNEVINFSNFQIYSLGLIAVFCFLWGGFVFYKKAIEAHFEEEIVFDMIVLSAFWSFIFGRVFFVINNLSDFVGHWMRIFLLPNFPGVDRWGILIGLCIGVTIIVKKKKAKYFDYMDLVTLGFVAAAPFFWLGVNFVAFYWQNILISVVTFLYFLFLWKLESNYRHIVWYRGSKSFARSGLVSGLGVSFLGVSFILEKFVFKSLVAGNFVFGLTVFMGGLVLVYIRSGRVLVDDIKLIKTWNKKIKK